MRPYFGVSSSANIARTVFREMSNGVAINFVANPPLAEPARTPAIPPLTKPPSCLGLHAATLDEESNPRTDTLVSFQSRVFGTLHRHEFPGCEHCWRRRPGRYGT